MFLIILIISFLMLSHNESRAIIIDNGSRTCKAGFAGDVIPKYIINSFVGTDPKTKDTYVSDDAYSKADLLNIEYPIDHRIIQNWDDMEKIWYYIFHNQFHVESSEHPVLLTDDPHNTKENRERMAQIMFETFNVPSLYVARRPVLSLYSAGRLNGIVLDSGDSSSLATPIYGGYYIQNATVPLNVGGKDVTIMLQQLLNEQGYNFTSFSQQEIVRDIKEKHCYLSLDFDSEIKKADNHLDYKLPDGKVIQIGKELFRSAELLLKPQINGFEAKGIVDILFESIDKCEEKIRNDLYSNIVVCGGSTKLKQFTIRIQEEIHKRIPNDININIIEPHRRQYASWIGGSTFASLPTFKDMAISIQDFNESGSGIVRKCP